MMLRGRVRRELLLLLAAPPDPERKRASPPPPPPEEAGARAAPRALPAENHTPRSYGASLAAPVHYLHTITQTLGTVLRIARAPAHPRAK